jgi:antitoxin component YwqK of YwqJK toxin-antitoxin module/Tfp pilus assembly protein PilF
MKKSILISLLALVVSFSAVSQTGQSALDQSTSLVERGIELYDNNEFHKAIEVFDSVSPCDPNYAWAIYEKSLCRWQLDENDEAYRLCREAHALNPSDAAIAITLGSILDDLGKTREAIDSFRSSLRKWPYNANLRFNLGVTYLRNNQPEEAEEVLLQGIRIKPFHATSHLALAQANFVMGRLSKSYLAYNMAILMNPELKLLTEFESCITGARDSLNKQHLYLRHNEDNAEKWEALDLLMRSELAFSEKFRFQGDLDFLTSRQSYLLFTNMNYDASDTSLYNQLYVRFFESMIKEKLFNTSLYYSYNQLENEKIKNWIQNNIENLRSFIEWSKTTIQKYRAYGYNPVNETAQYKMLHFDENDVLLGIGRMQEGNNSVKEGNWMITRGDGSVSERGFYKNDASEGDWYIYNEDGNPAQLLKFLGGVLEGESRAFHPNGRPLGIYPRKEGEMHGVDREFTLSGFPLTEFHAKDGLKEGTAKEYFYRQGYSRSTTFKNNKAEGPYTETWLNGITKTTGTYRDSIPEGFTITWYPDGSKESEGTLKNGLPAGAWIKYFPNGAKQETYGYDEEGLLSGIKLIYNREGKIIRKDSIYSGGFLNGIRTNYYPEGSISSIEELDYDTLISYKAFDHKGRQLASERLDQNKSIVYRTFYYDGTPESEGMIRNGLYEGQWKFFYPNGNVQNLLNFSGGLQSGRQISYHISGGIKDDFTCIDGLIEGEFRSFYPSGKLERKGNFTQNEYDGEWFEYYAYDTIESRTFYHKGLRKGLSMNFALSGRRYFDEFFNNEGDSYRLILYDAEGKPSADIDYSLDSIHFTDHYPSGQIRRKGLLSDNVFHGSQEWYYPNGRLQRVNNMLHGHHNGIMKYWDYRGNPEMEIPYVMNKTHGLIKRYESGRLNSVDPYEMDVNQGVFMEFHENGRVYRKINYGNDLKNGYAWYYSPDSVLMYRVLFIQDVIREISYLDKSGKYVPSIVATPELQDVKTYYPDGNVSAAFTLENGLFHGKFTSFYPGGRPFKEIHYNKGDNEGLSITYYPNGKLKEKQTFSQDMRHGDFTSYHPGGQKSTEGRYSFNREEGEWRYYDATGRMTGQLFYDSGDLYEIREL